MAASCRLWAVLASGSDRCETISGKVQTIGQDGRNRLAGRDSFLGACNISNLIGEHALESKLG